MLKVYPAIFKEDVTGGFYIQFPDIEGNGTQGDNVEQGLSNASDYLGIMLVDYIENEEPLPTPSDIKSIEVSENEFVTLIQVNINEYVKDSKKARTNITIPYWLKKQAEIKNLNISHIATKALMEEILG